MGSRYDVIELERVEQRRIAAAIAALAKVHGGTLTTLAPKLALGTNTLSKLARRVVDRVTPETLSKIAELAGCSVEDLRAGRGPT